MYQSTVLYCEPFQVHEDATILSFKKNTRPEAWALNLLCVKQVKTCILPTLFTYINYTNETDGTELVIEQKRTLIPRDTRI